MYTEAQCDVLREAIASGVLRVNYDGRTVEYRSLADMKAVLRLIEASLDPECRMTRQIRVSSDKDLF